MSDLDTIHHKAHAKINLTLAILGRRADGYHEIESWMAPISWHDEILLRKANEYSLEVTGSRDVPSDDQNLVTKAHTKLSAYTGKPLPTHIRLEKRIPTGAGLGGGSSDAAAALLGLNELWNLDLGLGELLPLAAAVGSDVAFFLYDTNAIVTGRGEQVQPIRGWHGCLVLLVPSFGISTAAVYAQYAKRPSSHHHGRPWENPDRAPRELQDELFNDLQAAAYVVEPRLAELHRKVDGIEGHRVLMSGSGSTLYAIFAESGAATMWEDKVKKIVGDDARVQVQTIDEDPVRSSWISEVRS